ncbi:MAG: hypothetical protein R6V01_06375 [Thermoplasmatota archaeon]
MAPDEKEHKKRLKEAEKTYGKSMKAFKQGKMSKEELKDTLRPYKYELKELGYPVKIKDDDEKAHQEKQGPEKAALKIDRTPWKKRSPLTLEEIEHRIDELSLGGDPSESLRRLYQDRYGEDLLPPENLVPFEPAAEELPERKAKGALPAADEEEEGTEKKDNRPFWKSLFKGSKDEGKELKGSD